MKDKQYCLTDIKSDRRRGCDVTGRAVQGSPRSNFELHLLYDIVLTSLPYQPVAIYLATMSSASFAALRKTQGEELAKLAEEHFKHE
jgi:hypothetical protein